MSYSGGAPGAPYGPTGAGRQQGGGSVGGSVRAARERLEAERELRAQREQQQDARTFNSPPTTRANPVASQHSSADIPQRPQPSGPSPQFSQPSSVGYPSQPPPAQSQWPLPSASRANTGPEEESTQQPLTSRGMLPSQRRSLTSNPTPTLNPPTFLDTTRDTMSPGGLQPPQAPYWQDDDYLSPSYGSPSMSRPLTNSSLASDSSSIGTIPDFPVPSAQVPPSVRRNNQFVGPPPSARRGPSSYYSQISYVSPIAEESSDVRASVGSFASSNVFPSDVPDFYLEDGSDDEGTVTGASPNIDNARGGENNNGGGLVRQASLGKRTKPTLTTIKSGETARPVMPANAQATATRAQTAQDIRSQMASPLATGSILLDPSSSSSSSQESLQKPALRTNGSMESLGLKPRSSYDNLSLGKSRTPPGASPASPSSRTIPSSPLGPIDSRMEHILGGLEKGGAISPGGSREFREAKKGSLADRVGSRRPPRLNVDAVRDAEARGSLTSLPDLIKRATRLAANLDRGKTASRLGFEWLDYEKGNRSKEFSPTGDNTNRQKTRRSTTLSGMLSAFPPPAVSTPGSPRTNWPASGTGSAKSLNPRSRRREPPPARKHEGRRCCGLRVWPAIFLILFFLTLIVAAIVIPVVLIVLPRRNAAPAASAGATAICQSKTTCQNGGGSVAMPDGSCGCLCTNGFTGPQCQTASDAGCSTMSVAGVKDASVGSQIPTLIDAAQTNYSIPLDATALLSLFASQNMTCGTENAMVTLTGSSASKRSELSLEEGTFELAHPQQIYERADTDPSASAAVTSNGIQIATLQPTPTRASTASTTSAIAIATGSSAPGTNSTSRDFARIGVLFVLQESKQMNVAIGAQEVLSNYMNSAAKQGSSMSLAHNVTLGSGYFIDLWFWTVTLSNGTVYGNGFNGSATTLNLP
jgi:hypothetical protein